MQFLSLSCAGTVDTEENTQGAIDVVVGIADLMTSVTYLMFVVLHTI